MKTVLTLLTAITLMVWMTPLSSSLYGQEQGYQPPASSGSQASMGQDKLTRLDLYRDTKVTNASNEDLGKITDFVIDKQQGVVAYAVLHYSYGKYFAVPWSALTLAPDGKSYTLDTTKQKLDQSQGFDKQWPDQPDYKLFNMGTTGTQYQPQSTQSKSDTIRGGTDLSQQYPNLEKESKIIGTNVSNMQKEKLGDIKDLLVDGQGRIVYAALAHGGFAAMGEKFIAVPWKVLQFKPDSNKIFLDATKDKIAKAPSFNKNSWPQTSNVAYSNYFEQSTPSGQGNIDNTTGGRDMNSVK